MVTSRLLNLRLTPFKHDLTYWANQGRIKQFLSEQESHYGLSEGNQDVL